MLRGMPFRSRTSSVHECRGSRVASTGVQGVPPPRPPGLPGDTDECAGCRVRHPGRGRPRTRAARRFGSSATGAGKHGSGAHAPLACRARPSARRACPDALATPRSADWHVRCSPGPLCPATSPGAIDGADASNRGTAPSSFSGNTHSIRGGDRPMPISRRRFIALSAAAATLLAGVPPRWAGGVYASDAPETPKVRIGIIALTDCSSIVMAHELGPLQEARHRVDDLEGGVVGGHPRPPHARREPGDAHALRDALRVDDGPPRLAEEADDHPVLPEPQRPGDHAHQGAARARA